MSVSSWSLRRIVAGTLTTVGCVVREELTGDVRTSVGPVPQGLGRGHCSGGWTVWALLGCSSKLHAYQRRQVRCCYSCSVICCAHEMTYSSNMDMPRPSSCEQRGQDVQVSAAVDKQCQRCNMVASHEMCTLNTESVKVRILCDFSVMPRVSEGVSRCANYGISV